MCVVTSKNMNPSSTLDFGGRGITLKSIAWVAHISIWSRALGEWHAFHKEMKVCNTKIQKFKKLEMKYISLEK